MANSTSSLLHHHLLLLPLILAAAVRVHGSTFGLDLHHRFSDKVRNWAQSVSLYVKDWPEEGTPEYYVALVDHDWARIRGRGLADLTYAGGNETVRLNRLGFLHYAEVDLGTPGVTFLVALDTGSDLLWVPCNCRKCAPTSEDIYDMKFNIFNSNASSTNKKVPCSSSLCEKQETCSSSTDHCPFKVKYVDNSSTSGFLLQDILHLITDDSKRKPIKASITFGCGQHQPSTFRHSTPNGLLGLGVGKISVPTTLHDAGLISTNSFSMCFSPNGQGRIRFGDSGSYNQNITRFYPGIPSYVVTVTDVNVGGRSLNAQFRAFFDTGSSFTILKDPVYSVLTGQFDVFMDRKRLSLGSRLPFDYCYAIGPNEKGISYPRLSLTMEGGKELDILDPLIFLGGASGKLNGFCLGILKSSHLDIIGQNFMTGYRMVFDRDNSTLGWEQFDCYENVESKHSRIEPEVDVGSSSRSSSNLLSQSLSQNILSFPLLFLALFSL